MVGYRLWRHQGKTQVNVSGLTNNRTQTEGGLHSERGIHYFLLGVEATHLTESGGISPLCLKYLVRLSVLLSHAFLWLCWHLLFHQTCICHCAAPLSSSYPSIHPSGRSLYIPSLVSLSFLTCCLNSPSPFHVTLCLISCKSFTAALLSFL